MGCGDDGIEGAPRLARALGEQRLRVACRLEFFEPALGENEESRDLWSTDEAKKRHGGRRCPQTKARVGRARREDR
jgi:hypothetical protein